MANYAIQQVTPINSSALRMLCSTLLAVSLSLLFSCSGDDSGGNGDPQGNNNTTSSDSNGNNNLSSADGVSEGKYDVWLVKVGNFDAVKCNKYSQADVEGLIYNGTAESRLVIKKKSPIEIIADLAEAEVNADNVFSGAMATAFNTVDKILVSSFCTVDEFYVLIGQNLNFKEDYAAICGKVKYNPTTQFCSGNMVYSKCGGNNYNPSTEQCCGNTKITAAQFCSGNTVYNKCSDAEYNPTTQFCYSTINTDAVYSKCGGVRYNYPSSFFCSGNAFYEKCGYEYNPITQYCHYNLDNSTNREIKNYDFAYGTFTDNRDGKTYKTVVIGGRTWMAENLRYYVSYTDDYGGCHDTHNCADYGLVYNWNEAMSICPDGWHLPSEAEWDALTTAVGGTGTGGRTGAGTKLKAAFRWSIYGGGNGTDDYGFLALPGGYASYNTSSGYYVYTNVGSAGYWWSSTESSAANAYNWIINSANVSRNSTAKGVKNSVRCIKDGSSIVTPSSSSITPSSSSVSPSSSSGGGTGDFCNYGTCVGGSGWSCTSGGCYRMPVDDNCVSGTVVSACPAGTKPPSADY